MLVLVRVVVLEEVTVCEGEPVGVLVLLIGAVRDGVDEEEVDRVVVVVLVG